VLDNATLFWLTNTTISAGRLYWEATDKKTNLFGPKNVSITVAVSVFPDDVIPAPRSYGAPKERLKAGAAIDGLKEHAWKLNPSGLAVSALWPKRAESTQGSSRVLGI
jgi:hypothetical protein